MSSPAEPGRAGTRVAVVGGGPAGLFAAERLRACGLSVDLYEAKGSPGRKFLIAGKGGLNLTHSEPRPQFDQRYCEREAEVAGWLDGFDADALRDWARGLGVDTYVGSSGRVFPLDRKAAPLLRGWVRRLKEQGVRFHVQHRWLGWNDDGSLRMQRSEGEIAVTADATLLALTCFTVLFGMGRSGSRSLWSSGINFAAVACCFGPPHKFIESSVDQRFYL